MSELPKGLALPRANTSNIVRSASVILSRERGTGHEILLGHRVSELASFPDYWSFPGGGISSVDKISAQELEGVLEVDERYKVACFALSLIHI